MTAIISILELDKTAAIVKIVGIGRTIAADPAKVAPKADPRLKTVEK